MPSRNKRDAPKALKFLGETRTVDALASGAVAVGILLVALDMILQSQLEDFTTAFRIIGGILFLIGIATLVFGDARRRETVMLMLQRVTARYMARSAGWGWTFRYGVAATVIGLILILPALFLQFIFGTTFGVMILAILVFCSGIALIAYGVYLRRKAAQKRAQSKPPQNRSGRR